MTGQQFDLLYREYARHRAMAASHAAEADHPLWYLRGRPGADGILAVSLLDRPAAIKANLAKFTADTSELEHRP